MRLGGGMYSLRPTHRAYGEIEARSGKSLREVYTSTITGCATLADMAMIVCIGTREAGGDEQGRQLEEGRTAEALFQMGCFSDDVIVPIAEYLGSLGWTPEQRKKIEAEVERAQTQATPSA